jgi:hypothetical protein
MVLRGDFETRATAAQQLISSGVYKPAEARVLFDLPDAGPVADQLYGNAALVPLGSTPRTPAAPESTSPLEGADPAHALSARQSAEQLERAVMGRIGRVKAQRDALRATLTREHERAVQHYFDRQAVAVQLAAQRKDAGLLDTDEWDSDLADVLLPLARATSRAVGDQVAAKLNAGYDPDEILAWLQTNAGKSAAHINATTAEHLADAVQADAESGEPAGPLVASRNYFGSLSGRIAAIAASRVVLVAGLAAQSAAKQGGGKYKTWRTGTGKPRDSHAQMDGETVPIDDTFSNGMNAPGDPSGGADEVAGCTCDLDISTEA